MPERMGVDVGKVVPHGELAQPRRYAAGNHRLPVVLHKQEIGIVPAVAVL